MNQRSIFTDEDLEKLLYDLYYPAYLLEGVPTAEYALARRVRDAVEDKVMVTRGLHFRHGKWYGYPAAPQPVWKHDEGWP